MTKAEEQITSMINNIWDNNFSDAKDNLKSAMAEKIKDQMKEHMDQDLKETK